MVGGRISLNCSLVPPTTNNESLHTPNTPEILNTIVNISFNSPSMGLERLEGHSPCLASPSSVSSLSDSSEYTGNSAAASPAQPGAVQLYTKQFIKEGLKMKVKQNIKEEASEDSKICIKQERQDLTPEDEERRNRRRERNKLAATKCRNKKKEATAELIKESEVVEALNQSLKQELSRLEAEERQLTEVLHTHSRSASCCRPWKRRKLDQPEHSPEDSTRETDQLFRVPEIPDLSSQQNLEASHEQLGKEEQLYQVYSDLVTHRPGTSSAEVVQSVSPSYSSLPSYPGYFDTMCLAI